MIRCINHDLLDRTDVGYDAVLPDRPGQKRQIADVGAHGSAEEDHVAVPEERILLLAGAVDHALLQRLVQRRAGPGVSDEFRLAAEFSEGLRDRSADQSEPDKSDSFHKKPPFRFVWFTVTHLF